MKRALAAFAFCLLGLALVRVPALGEGSWVQLLDGKSLDGFEQIGDANWRLEDGVLVADRGNGYLVSKASYTDFELRAEFWVGDDANSGIFIRVTNPKEINAKNAYEVNIWDERPQKDYATGAIVNVAKVDPMPTTVGKWNLYEITVKGDTFTVVLNGQKTVDGAKDDKLKAGRIALQHGPGNKDASGKVNDKGVVKFRKVEIKAL
jgi:hypothetical protein